MSQIRVLVVDDDPWILRMVSSSLEKKGTYSVETARDGEEAYRKAQNNKPDMIITDVMMPVMDGWALVQQLRANPALADVPVLFLTALGKDEDRLHALGLKPDDYVSKPFRFDDLERRVLKALAKRGKVEEPSSQPGFGRGFGGAPGGYTQGHGGGYNQRGGFGGGPGPGMGGGYGPPGGGYGGGYGGGPGGYNQGPGPGPGPNSGPGPGMGGGYGPPGGGYGPPGGGYGPPGGGYGGYGQPGPGPQGPGGYNQGPNPGGYGPPGAPAHPGQAPPAPEQQPAAGVPQVVEGQGSFSGAMKRTGLSGRLEQLGLSSLLVMMEMERKDGVLQVQRAEDKKVGRIFLRKGQVIQAKIDKDDTERDGRESVYFMLTWQKGRFHFTAMDVEMEDTVQTSTTSLLMEGARLIDEANR